MSNSEGGRDQGVTLGRKRSDDFPFVFCFADNFFLVGKIVHGEVSWGEPFSRYALRAVVDSDNAADKFAALKRVERLMKRSRFDLDAQFR